MAGAGQGALLKGLHACGHAFTMAEILLSLTIIGVVAAITLPSLTGNINERTWNTQRKALYARFSQAMALMPALNGYGTVTQESSEGADDAVDTAAETFITDGLAKVMKINNICDADHLEDCGIPGTINKINGDVISGFNTSPYNTLAGLNSLLISTPALQTGVVESKAAAFETQNGESIVVYYNRNCNGDSNETEAHWAQSRMCANFIYDLNGNKGPNTVGKDIGFITALYPSDPIVVAPMPMPREAGISAHTGASALCKAQDSEARLPNRDELSAMFFNKTIIGINSANLWSGSIASFGDSGKAWYQSLQNGNSYPATRSYAERVWCVRR